MPDATGLLVLNPAQARTVAAVFDRCFPADGHSAAASDLGAVAYLDRALAGPYRGDVEAYRLGLSALDGAARGRHGRSLADCDSQQQDALLRDLEREALPDFAVPRQFAFFELLLAHLVEGLFADPAHGGNRDKQGWRFLGHPGFHRTNAAEEHVAAEPVVKEIRSLADAGFTLGDGAHERVEVPGYEPQRSVEAPSGPVDVVLVGVGAVGSVVAPLLAGAGLRVVGLEAGPYRTRTDFVPDELTSTYYTRGDMGPKFLAETPRWRRNAGEPTRPATYSLGRMMNGVGGSVIHWGGVLRRLHPHHFAYLTHVRERFGEQVLPETHALADWPVTYEDLEPYYARVEALVGVAGDDANPFVPRSGPYPLPPLRPFRMGELFRDATAGMGLHPYRSPVAVNSRPYNGLPESSYCAWMGGFGPFDDDRWHPGLTSVPQALASGFDLRTHCRVVRILTDVDGHARGVEYLDGLGVRHVQEARTVILASYTFENVRLMFLSGVGNTRGQLGRYFMTKMWADTYGLFGDDMVFNAQTGPAAQMWCLDDFVSASFEAPRHGFVGGATPNVENQRLPIQIAREGPPDDVPRWGQAYKDHLRRWQQTAAVRIQPDSLPYVTDFLDLDPDHGDRSGLGIPVVRITCDLRANERRLADFMEAKGEQILRQMGARQTWRGPRFRGVCSSHDLGGARMGVDPSVSVVDPTLRVHDTPGLYVFGGAVFPTCHGVNPTLTMWALCTRAAEQLIDRLRRGEEA